MFEIIEKIDIYLSYEILEKIVCGPKPFGIFIFLE